MPKPTRKSAPLIALAVILLLGACVALTSGYWGGASDDLLKRSKILTTIPCLSYAWVSDGTLRLRVVNRTQTHLNLTTKLATPIPGVQPNNGPLTVFRSQFSPDGMWSLVGDNSTRTWIATSLDGKIKTWSYLPGLKFAEDGRWLSDNRQWVETYFGPRGDHFYAIRSLDQPGLLVQNKTNAFVNYLCMLPDNKILGWVWHPQEIELTRYDLKKGKEKSLFRVPFKTGSKIGYRYGTPYFAVSPRGDSIAWFQLDPLKLTVFDRIGDYLPAFRSAQKYSLWAAKIDGSEKKLLGRMNKLNSSSDPNLKWTPDGKGLSFIFKLEIYVTSADL